MCDSWCVGEEGAHWQTCARRAPHASQMRWLFVGEALVLRKDLRISMFIVLKTRWQCFCLSFSCLSAIKRQLLLDII